MASVDDCRLLDFPSFQDQRGTLTAVEARTDVPFAVARVFWLYGMPTGAGRGGHAHKKCLQLLVCMAGACKVKLDDGAERCAVSLTKPNQGLLIEPLVWAELTEFTGAARVMVLASEPYDEHDYLRDYATFMAAAGGT